MNIDFAAWSEWLRSTIPGVIVLGAIGSTLAMFVVWACRWCFHAGSQLLFSILPQRARRLRDLYVKRRSRLHYQYGYDFGNMLGGVDPSGTTIYLVYELGLAFVWLIIAATTTILFAVIWLAAARPELTAGSYVFVVTAFAAGYRSFRHFLGLWLARANFRFLYEDGTFTPRENGTTSRSHAEGGTPVQGAVVGATTGAQPNSALELSAELPSIK